MDSQSEATDVRVYVVGRIESWSRLSEQSFRGVLPSRLEWGRLLLYNEV